MARYYLISFDRLDIENVLRCVPHNATKLFYPCGRELEDLATHCHKAYEAGISSSALTS